MYSIQLPDKPCKPIERPALRSTHLLDQLRERIRYRHDSLRTEQAYAYWICAFVHFHALKRPLDVIAH